MAKYSPLNLKPFGMRQNLRGIVQNRNEHFLTVAEAADIVNMHATEEGAWSADNQGYTEVNATAFESGARINGMVWFTESDFTEHLLIAINGKLKEVDLNAGTAANVDASAAYSLTGQVDFEVFNNNLFSCDGVITAPRKWDGTTAAVSGGWPVTDGTTTFTAPKFVENYDQRLVYATNTHIILSNYQNAETFTLPASTDTDAYFNQPGLGDGQKIRGMRTLFVGGSGQQLIIFKDRSIYTLTGRSATLLGEDPITVERINGNYGAFNNRCIVAVGNDLLALNEYGVISYGSSMDAGTLQPAAIESDLVRDVLSRANLAQKDQFWGLHIPERREVWFGIATGASAQINEYLVYKYPSPGDESTTPKWSRRTDAGVFRVPCMALVGKDLYAGTYTGKVLKMFNSSKYGVIGIPWRYEHASSNLGAERQIKKVQDGFAFFRARESQDVTMNAQWEKGGNNNRTTGNVRLQAAVGGAEYGTAIYGTAVYGESEVAKGKFKVFGNGERVKVAFSGTTADTGPVYMGSTLLVEMSGFSRHWN